MTDISEIVASERTIDILHPKTSAILGLKITLRPDTHPKVKEQVRRTLDDRISGKAKITSEKIEANRIDLITASIENWDWEGDLNFQGSKPECTEANVRKVLKALPWIKEQIDKELGESEAFFPDDAGSAD